MKSNEDAAVAHVYCGVLRASPWDLSGTQLPAVAHRRSQTLPRWAARADAGSWSTALAFRPPLLHFFGTVRSPATPPSGSSNLNILLCWPQVDIFKKTPRWQAGTWTWIHAWMCRGQGKWRQTKPEGDRAGPEGGGARSREVTKGSRGLWCESGQGSPGHRKRIGEGNRIIFFT
jgi:hypothetical protein